MQHSDQKPEPGGGQDNIGYENTEVRNNQDDQENSRLETTETGLGEDRKKKKRIPPGSALSLARNRLEKNPAIQSRADKTWQVLSGRLFLNLLLGKT